MGSTATLGCIFATSASFVLTGQIYLATVETYHRTYVAKTYQIWLVVVAIACVSILVNTIWVKAMPTILRAVVYFLLASTVYIMTALLVRTTPKASAATVFLDVVNDTGWSSHGLVFLLCLLPGSTAVSAFDCATHLTEELPRPDRQVPQIMLSTAVLSAGSGLVMVLVYLFCATNPQALIAPLGGQPVFQVFHDSLDSDALLITALSIFCIEYMVACIAVVTTSSRVLWTFAAHGGIPFGSFLGHVSKADKIPQNAVVVVSVVGILLSTLVLGPTAILNAMFGATAICTTISIGVPIAILLLNQRTSLPRSRYINLGRGGPLINILSICWLLTLAFFVSMPLYLPVTASNMNYAMPLVVVAIGLVAINWYGYSRKVFIVPRPLYIEGFSTLGPISPIEVKTTTQ